MTSIGEEHNPYAAPQAALQLESVQSGPAAFYAMSPRKAAVMSVLTFTLYDLVFWYRHWAQLKRSGHDVAPAIRAFFAGFTSFSFVSILSMSREARGLESSSLRGLAGIYLGLNIGARLTDRILEGVPSLVLTAIVCACCAWVLATIQHAVNEVLEADNYRGPSNVGSTVGSVIAAAAGLALWIFALVSAVSPGWMDLE